MVRTHDEDGTRLDKALVDRGLVPSRARAQSLIRAKGVKVDGVIVTSKDFLVDDHSEVVLAGKDLRWVSRAGLKLEHALQFWNISVEGMVALDVGASTGGFTDVLLDAGVKKVYAIDVGHNLQVQERSKMQSLSTGSEFL